MIFGTAAPKFIYDFGGASEDEVNLDYAVILKDEPDFRYLINQSEGATGARDLVNKGMHWNYTVQLHLYKYGNSAAVLSKFNEIYQYLYQKVILYRHRDKDPFKDSSGNHVEFIINKITMSYVERIDYRDAITIEFISAAPKIDLTKSLDATLYEEDLTDPITTEDGSEIILG